MNNRGYFGVGIFHGKHGENQGTLWRSAYCFGASFVFTVGRRFEEQASDTVKANRHVPTYRYRDLEELVGHLPHGCPLVGVELDDRAWPLDRFVHPERACYLLGAEDHGLPAAVLGRCHMVVKIPGLSHCLNVATAGSVVMYDRTCKRMYFREAQAVLRARLHEAEAEASRLRLQLREGGRVFED